MKCLLSVLIALSFASTVQAQGKPVDAGAAGAEKRAEAQQKRDAGLAKKDEAMARAQEQKDAALAKKDEALKRAQKKKDAALAKRGGQDRPVKAVDAQAALDQKSVQSDCMKSVADDLKSAVEEMRTCIRQVDRTQKDMIKSQIEACRNDAINGDEIKAAFESCKVVK